MILENFLEKCKAHRLKITPQRIAVYNAVKNSKVHPTADFIYKKLKSDFPSISLDTVNRTLLTFSDIHLIDIVEGFGDPRRYESDLSPHHHFYCLGCKTIFDISDTDLIPIKLPKKINSQYTVTGHRLIIKGYCSKCNPFEI